MRCRPVSQTYRGGHDALQIVGDRVNALNDCGDGGVRGCGRRADDEEMLTFERDRCRIEIVDPFD